MVAKKKTAPAQDGEAVPGAASGPEKKVKGWGAKVAPPAEDSSRLAGAPGFDLSEEQRAALTIPAAALQEAFTTDTPGGRPSEEQLSAAAEAAKPKEPEAESLLPGANLKISSDKVAQDQLLAFVERVERLKEEADAIAEDTKEVFAEAKANGFEVKILREVIRRRRMDVSTVKEHDALLDLYEHAIGSEIVKFEEDEDEES